MHFRATLISAVLAATPALSQDLIGFDLSSFGKTVLSTTQSAGDITLEAAFGAYNNEFIATYSPNSVFARMGRAVGRLDVATDAGVFPCTAFLVDDDLLMTNHHCVPGILENPRAKATAIVGVQFVAGYLNEGIEEGSERFIVNPVPVETSKPLDYTLLRIVGAKPGQTYGTLALVADAPDDNAPFWIIGHPMGEAQRISREKCRANAPALSDDRVLHTCDTLPGNSGSPVIDASSQKVVALHHAGSARNSVNYAVPMADILRNSGVLKAAAPAAEPDRETRADRALARLFGLPDDAALETGLDRLIAEFPGTSAARSAQARLDRMREARQQADGLAREARANQALMAALVVTEPDAQKAALDRLIANFPDTAAASAARATLRSRVQPVPTEDKPDPDPDAYPAGTRVLVKSVEIRARPSQEAPVISLSRGIVELGAHVSGRWYRTGYNENRYLLLPPDARLVRTTPAPAAGTYAPGTVLRIGLLPIYPQPLNYVQPVSRMTGEIRVGKHIGGEWYTPHGHDDQFVKLPPGLKTLSP
ncbi:trypsin-like serine peptidase [Maliponia aquimaris]|uniref:Serine protease n=1 Tax=Maliponia aquimaris TaxID=1673631 RepID=A0A238K651_9RHOB|nr:serine protease [Maliponia aquimaris]SMX38390.1 Trypsin [Maliponia aquimaris]